MQVLNPLSRGDPRGAHSANKDNTVLQPPLGTSAALGFVFHFLLLSLLSPCEM